MKIWQIVSVDGKGQVQQVEVERPAPGPGEVLVKMHAASLNHRDLYFLEPPYPETPFIPLSDGVGEVIELGEGSSRLQVGDRVALTFFPNWFDGPLRAEILGGRGEHRTPGVLAEYVVAKEQEPLLLPAYLSYVEGATLPCAGVTAWNALASGPLRAGDSVLLLGTGGVSIFGLQFAKAAGALAIMVSRSDEKLQRARVLGADGLINSATTPHWDKQVQALTDGRGVDHVLEVGGAGTLERSLRSTRLGGRVNLIGGLEGFTGSVEFGAVHQQLGIVQSFYVGSRAIFADMLAFMIEHQIHPIVDRVFAFEQSREAFEYLAGANHVGKVVITW